MNAIDLYSIFLYRSVTGRASPAQSSRIGSDASKGNIGRLRYIDAEDID